MATKLMVTALVATLFLGTAFGTPSQRLPPSLCDAEGESSEECPRGPQPVPSTGVLRADPESLRVRFLLYKNLANPESYVEIFPNSPESVMRANPYPASWKSWKVLISGFPLNNRSPFPMNVRDAYMQRMRDFPQEPRYNILVVDWDQAGCPEDTSFPNGTTYTEAVGKKVAEMMLFLNDEGHLNLNTDVHVIGFSLGAHVAGEMARFIFRQYAKKNLLYRLTALDPAGEGFWRNHGFAGKRSRGLMPSPMRKVPAIRRSFVWFLDAYHTSVGYGIQRHIGDVDFYPNGGSKQEKACKRSLNGPANFDQLCSHLYTTELFAESITNRKVKGCTGCDEYRYYLQGKCGVDNAPCEDEPYYGDAVDEQLTENYPNATGRAFLEFDLPNMRYGQFGEELKNRLVVPGGRGRDDAKNLLCG